MTTLSPGSIHGDFQALKAAYPLAEMVERAGIRLRRVGHGAFQGLCPFHAERTPSFTIWVGSQRFRCFGCGERGDVLDFVRLHQHLASVGEARAWLVGSRRLRRPVRLAPTRLRWSSRSAAGTGSASRSNW